MGDAAPLSRQDVALWCAERPSAPLQVGALCRFGPGALRDASGRVRHDALAAHVASRLHRLPRFRQVLCTVPLGAGPPVWVDDVHFDLGHHLRTETLDRPGDDATLRRFVASLLASPLDPARPLWELWAVDGLDDGGVAVVLRASHLVADGLSLVRTATVLLDAVADPGPAPPPAPWQPRPAPGAAGLLAGAVVARTRARVGLVASAARWVTHPAGAAGLALSLPGATAGLVSAALRAGPRPAVSGPVGERRDFLWASVPLGPLHDAGHRAGATVNDLVMAAVALALGSGVAAQVLVPVGGTAGPGNDFSFLVAGLPAGAVGPAAAVAEVRATMAARKASEQTDVLRALFSLVDVVPVPVLRAVVPVVLARQPFVDLAVTDLTGADVPLFLLGAPMVEVVPLVTGTGNVACVVGVLSYRGRLGVGLTVDPDVVRDADGLLRRLVDALGALADAV